MTRIGDLIGYARVSTWEQNTELQHDALLQAGCIRIFEETASGTKTDRPQLTAALDFARPGDTVVVWRLDRLGRSLKHLMETVTLLEERNVGSDHCTRASTRRPQQAAWCFTSSERSPSSNAT